MKNNWFEVDHKGMRELHAGRESWQLIKELVSNSFDEESVTICAVQLNTKTERTAILRVEDNGLGFADIKDAWTLMAHTPKREKPTVRGRFNIGEKELLCTAKSATILTSGYRISFTDKGRRATRTDTNGTTITATLYLGSRQVQTAIDMLRQINPPPKVTYLINGEHIPTRNPYQTTEVDLETVIWVNGVESRRLREAEVEIHRNDNWLYEMGIPVQKLGCPYGVNILQKIPMPPNRDVVRDSYLQDIYALVLNHMAEEVENPSDTWVRTALEDKDITSLAVKAIVTKRYGDKVVLWSADPRANDKARLAGYEVVHGRTLSEGERNAMRDLAGIKSSADFFPTSLKAVTPIPEEKWTDGMKHTVQFAQYLHELLLSRPLVVEFISDIQIGSMASYTSGYLTFNKVHCGNGWFDAVTPNMVGVLLHEFSHNKTDLDSEHGSRWYAEFERLAGRATQLAATDTRLQEYLKREQ